MKNCIAEDENKSYESKKENILGYLNIKILNSFIVLWRNSPKKFGSILFRQYCILLIC